MQAILTVSDKKVTCLCAVVRKDGNYHIEAQTEESFSPIRRNKPVSGLGIRNAVQRALSRALKETGKRIDQVHVGVPGAFCQTVVESMSAQDEEDETGFLYGDQRYELIDQYEIRGHKKVLILSLRDYTEEISIALDSLRLRVSSLYAQTKVLGSYLIPHSMRQQVAILLDMGYYHSDICVFTGNGQIFSASMYLGSGHIAADIAQVLDIELPLAEQLKRQFAYGIQMDEGAMDYVRLPDGRLQAFSHELIENIVSARVDEMCELVLETLSHSPAEPTEQSRLYLLGDGIRGIACLRDYIGNRLGYRVERLPISISDGTTKKEPLSTSLLEHVIDNATDKHKGRMRLFRRFARNKEA